jgi:hypothetical protein
MKRGYKISIGVIVAGTLVLLGVTFLFNGRFAKESTNIEKKESANIMELELTDFKHKEEYQFCKIPWGSSLEEVKTMMTYSLLEDPGRPPTSDGKAFYISLEDYMLKGKSATAVYEFNNDKLVGVQLVFSSAENAVELFDPIITEITELFGMESEKFESEYTDDISYLWKTNNTLLEIDSVNINGAKLMIFISCTDV